MHANHHLYQARDITSSIYWGQSPSSETNNHSASQETYCPLRNAKVHYCVDTGLLGSNAR
jgi:hypothetical protein